MWNKYSDMSIVKKHKTKFSQFFILLFGIPVKWKAVKCPLMSAITERAQKPRISIRCQYKISNFSYTDNSNINTKLLQIASPAMLE